MGSSGLRRRTIGSAWAGSPTSTWYTTGPSCGRRVTAGEGIASRDSSQRAGSISVKKPPAPAEVPYEGAGTVRAKAPPSARRRARVEADAADLEGARHRPRTCVPARGGRLRRGLDDICFHTGSCTPCAGLDTRPPQ